MFGEAGMKLREGFRWQHVQQVVCSIEGPVSGGFVSINSNCRVICMFQEPMN